MSILHHQLANMTARRPRSSHQRVVQGIVKKGVALYFTSYVNSVVGELNPCLVPITTYALAFSYIAWVQVVIDTLNDFKRECCIKLLHVDNVVEEGEKKKENV